MKFFAMLFATCASVAAISAPPREQAPETALDDQHRDLQTCTLGTTTSCSTSVAAGLTTQIVNKMNANGISFSPLSASYTRCSGACSPYLQTGASNALTAAARSKNDYITLNSALRSSAQQYLLYKWKQYGQCSQTNPVATPGTSNHEAGKAVDVSATDYWRSTLAAYNYRWFGSTDAVHYDYQGTSSSTDVAREGLRAFQQLHNAAGRSPVLTTDGIYGPNTASALYNAPCSGF